MILRFTLFKMRSRRQKPILQNIFRSSYHVTRFRIKLMVLRKWQDYLLSVPRSFYLYRFR